MTELFVCPRCGARSAHPDDVREGYCGHCHDWTGLRRALAAVLAGLVLFADLMVIGWAYALL